MFRCAFLTVRVGLLSALLCAASAPALAQRTFSAATLRGEVVVTLAPDVLLNGKPARLAPGARIRAANNMMALSGELAGMRLLVHYTLDLQGQILNMWVLTPQEAANKPWPVTPQQAQTWQFNAAQQAWSPR